MKPQSQRQLRVGEQIRHVIYDILLRDSFDLPNVSVTEVRMSPDLKNATVFIHAITEEDQTIVSLFNEEAGKIRHRLGQRVNLKFTPKLTFKYDESFAYANRIESLLQK